MISVDSLAYASAFDEESWGSPPSYLMNTASGAPHPWKTPSGSDTLTSDFILIAEFSELEGPVPVVNKLLSNNSSVISGLCRLIFTIWFAHVNIN